MLQAVADTHALIWQLSDDRRISRKAQERFERAAETGGRIGVSTVSLIEIIYLEEKGRLPSDALRRLNTALDAPQSILLELPLTRLVAMSVSNVDRNQVPDLPDRIIAATADLYNVPVISRDNRIAASGVASIW